ncbi:Uncharacterised protein [Mycobacteroides abscessus subsp. abscessus]|nr:Uncharacterised protein [Mycobacteroides abscessus subsp. abscessus]
MATVSPTVATSTTVTGQGERLRVRGATERQSKVVTAMNTITAVSAAIGIAASRSASTRASSSTEPAAASVDRRVRARPCRTLIMVCPIIAHPPIAPKHPAAMFAAPSAQASRVLSEPVPVMSSTRRAVSRDSTSPTTAIAAAIGTIAVHAPASVGRLGSPRLGRPWGSAPRSPTVGTVHPSSHAAAVTTTTAASGPGTAVLRRGSRKTTSSPRATSGYTAQGTPISSGSCEVKIRMARASTNPRITAGGISRISFAAPHTASTTCSAPERMTASR